MRVEFSERLQESFAIAPAEIKKAFRKQVEFLQFNLRHPSLRAKKYSESENIWQARVGHDWRFYFKISGDVYIVVDLTKHPK